MQLKQALEVAIAAAREAGALLREEFHRPGGARGSAGHAEADEVAERIIRQRLRAFAPWSYRGEELGYQRGSDPQWLWLVDPNDGTAAYLEGWRGSAVSIAALRDGIPVLGVVYAFVFPDSEGDLIAWAQGCPLTRNGLEVAGPPAMATTAKAPAIVFVSHQADRNSLANAESVAPARFIALPSIAYRLARAAVQDGAAAVSLNAPSGWDYAAGHALVRGAEGVLIDERGQEVTYAPDGSSSVQRCFGGDREVVQTLYQRDWDKVFQRTSRQGASLVLVRPAAGRAIADSGMLARAQGCLLGQLAGDSLGGLVEFETSQAIRRAHPDGVHELLDGGTWHNLAGQATDDSELALMLARTLARDRRYEASAALDAYVHWWPHAWDRGSTLSQALAAAVRGTSTAQRMRLAEEHASRTSQSNGSLMRISPLGIFGAGRPAAAADWARQDSRLTHPHAVCQDACAVLVTAIAAAISDGGPPNHCFELALGEARRTAHVDVISALERAQESAPADYERQMGWVLIALQNAFFQLLHAANLEDGVCDTVLRGGDTDTNAAIAGALLGAVYGRRGIPDRWISAIQSCRPLPGSGTAHPQPSEFWPVDALDLAEAVLAAAVFDSPNKDS